MDDATENNTPVIVVDASGESRMIRHLLSEVASNEVSPSAGEPSLMQQLLFEEISNDSQFSNIMCASNAQPGTRIDAFGGESGCTFGAQSPLDVADNFPTKAEPMVTDSIIDDDDVEEVDYFGVPISQWLTVKINYVDPYVTEMKRYRCSCCRVVVGHYSSHRAKDRKDLHEYKCDSCDKSFEKKASLARHKLRHREKSVKCDYCPKKFHTKVECQTHAARHLPMKQFSCNFCPQKLVSKANLMKHIQNYHVAGMSCTTCVRVSVIRFTSIHFKNVNVDQQKTS